MQRFSILMTVETDDLPRIEQMEDAIKDALDVGRFDIRVCSFIIVATDDALCS